MIEVREEWEYVWAYRQQDQGERKGKRSSRCWDSTAACEEDHHEAAVHMQPMKGHGGWLKIGCDIVGSPHFSKVLSRPRDVWKEKPTLKQVSWQDLRLHGGPMLEQLMKYCSLWKGLTLEKYMKDWTPHWNRDSSPWEGSSK